MQGEKGVHFSERVKLSEWGVLPGRWRGSPLGDRDL